MKKLLAILLIGLMISTPAFASRQFTRDYNLEVLKGNIVSSVMVSINAHNDSATTTRVVVTPDVTTENIDQSGLHSVAATVDIASTSTDDTSAGSGLRTLLLIGLDTNDNIQSETISLNGQTEVTSSNTYSAIHGFRGLTAGAGNTSAGTIWAGNGVFTSGVPATKYCSADAGHNKSLCGYYSVPAGKTLFLRQLTMTMVGSGKEADIHIESSSDGIFWITENLFGIESGVDFQGNIIAVPGIVSGNHIRINAEAGAMGTELTIILGAELVND